MTIIQAREVAEYLISLGHKQIAFIGGSDLLVTRDRLAGMSDALKLADIVLPKEYILHFDFRGKVVNKLLRN